jgi:pilus assembly protein CpaE
VIGVAQSRGGLGATTLAVNLATRLLDPKGAFNKGTRHKVAILDLDIQYGSVASNLDIEPNDALYQMAADGTIPDANFVEQALCDHRSGLRVLTAPKTICPIDAFQHSQAAALIETLRASHDFVVVDLPRVLCDWLPAVVDRMDRLILLTDTTVPAIRQARRLIDLLTEETLNLDVQIVVSRETRPMISKTHHKVAQQVLERDFAHWLPDDAKTCRAASDRGVPVADVSRRSPLSRAIDGIARQMIEDVKTRQATVNLA